MTSCVTILCLAVLCFFTEDDLIVFERFYAYYVEAITKQQHSTLIAANDSVLLSYAKIFDATESPPKFPPNAWIVPEMLKAFGAFFGMVSAKVIMASLLWLVFEMKFQPAESSGILEEEEENEHDEVKTSKTPPTPSD